MADYGQAVPTHRSDAIHWQICCGLASFSDLFLYHILAVSNVLFGRILIHQAIEALTIDRERLYIFQLYLTSAHVQGKDMGQPAPSINSLHGSAAS